MFGGIGSFITSEISGTVRRNLVVLGLYGFAALLLFCAGGYALHALHVVLERYYGAVAASLWIAGGLLAVAFIAFLTAIFMKSRRPPPRPAATTAAFAAAPLAAKLLSSRRGWRIALAGGVVVLGAILGRQIVAGSGDDADEDA